ncbi:phospholipid-transporting ATPase IK isoform X1 [Monodelphis domestica]|uniref:phospholipid-transporting ATPase IK isoform X1 n=2 Tax=Monodelphis domestica TaxID=13616 RepID=UPI0024E2427F|nr:phospholipid-transporting ATPase IK isoform X1 [Monodelphis domestica]
MGMNDQNCQDSCRGGSKVSDFTWEVKANDRAFHLKFKKKLFLCWKRRKYRDNAIKTAKYNMLTFLPLNLYEQFHRSANLYFLFVVLLQTIPEISTLPWFSLMMPLVCLLIIRGTRDLVDDIARYRSDRMINGRPCEILMEKSFCKKRWRDIHVGDVVCLQKDDFVPADLLLLATSEPSSLCYVETADIDGETNLKFRQALIITHKELVSVDKMAAFDGIVVCEEPNSRMHTFVGTLEWKGEKYSLDSEKILLRGCRIRNTDICYGLVIYAGFDSKIMKNSGKIKLKRTKLDRMMNKLVIFIFLMLVVISLCLAVAYSFQVVDFQAKHSYLNEFHRNSSPVQEAFLVFWGFMILLSVIVPMSLYITFEFVYLVNSCFINWDLEMYYSPQDIPANARNTSLNDQLGQIEYIFSDKTGTLTQNIMTFKKCCINGLIYGTDGGEDLKAISWRWNKYADENLIFYDSQLLEDVLKDEDEVAREFWRLLALCHTVMVDEKDGQLVYQAASPDEEALVTAARNFGYVFLSRTQDTITTIELGVERIYQVLAMMDFNSSRKRMSVLVRDPEGKIRLYTKGADTVIFERLQPGCPNELATEKALDTFAKQTLRTLCLASKEVEDEFYQEWSKRHHAASVLLQNRSQALEKIYEDMEKDLKLLGATAIEDKLQDGVPDTIDLLKKGNIKVWVLTGDKQETAVNIGFACRLLSDDMEILDEKEIQEMVEICSESNNNFGGVLNCDSRLQQQQGKLALVVTGDFLDTLLPKAEESQASEKKSSLLAMVGEHCRIWQAPEDLAIRRERAFVDLATQCQAVICCRVTPKQKALIVQMIKKYQKVITLAIGDGANDVNMIKTADIGVGISGQEGMQAVQCSDYALAQFSYLKRLLLVHGRWSYLRISKFLRYFFYKTFASMMVQIWFAFYNGFTAQPLYEGWFLALYNVFYSAYPVLSMGLLEQDMSAKKCLEFPELYSVGQKNQLFNYQVFFVALAQGVATSLVNFYVTVWAFTDTAGPGGICDYQTFAITVATSALFSVIAEIIIDIKFWTILSFLAVSSSVILYSLMSFLTQNFSAFHMAPTIFRFLDVNQNALTEPYILLVVLLTVITNTMPSLAVRLLCHIIAESESRRSYQDSRMEVSAVELTAHFQRGSFGRRSSYAFSHKEGYAELITRGTSLRKKDTQTIGGISSNGGSMPATKDSPDPRTSVPVKESP